MKLFIVQKSSGCNISNTIDSDDVIRNKKCICEINTETVFHRDIQTPRRELKIRRFDEIQGVWTADETLTRVFDISAQSKQKLRSKRRSKIVESMLIKTGYPDLQGCDFLCFNLMNY